jgi:hypothetical protein
MKKQSWYTSPLKLRQGMISTAFGKDAVEKKQAFEKLKSLIPRGTLTVEKYLNLAKQNKVPSIIVEDMNEQVLKAIKEQGGFGETFQKNWSTGVVEPTFKGGRLDIDVEDLNPSEMTVKPSDVLYIAKGGVARKNYFHGGILGLNESEEIIDDDGNDIELTAYNAAFDDPKDLSTGVRTLFQAKDGGGDFDVKKKYKKSNLVTAPKYWKSAPDHQGTELAYITKPEKDLLLKVDLHNSLNNKPNKGPAGIISLNGWESEFSTDWGGEAAPQGSPPGHDPGPGIVREVGGDASIAEEIAAQDRKRRQAIKDIIARGDEEKYDTDLVGMTPNEKYNARRNAIKEKYTGISHKRVQGLTTNYNTEKARLEKKIANFFLKTFGLAFGLGIVPTPASFVDIDWKNKKLSGVLGDAMTLDKLKKQQIEDLTDMKDSLLVDVDINNPNEMKNLDDTAFPDIMKKLKELTKTKDEDEDRESPEYVPTIQLLEEQMQGVLDPKDWMAEIRARQAKREIVQPDWKLTAAEKELKYNPIVGESVTDITMQANSGGLANLFRVKNQ